MPNMGKGEETRKEKESKTGDIKKQNNGKIRNRILTKKKKE